MKILADMHISPRTVQFLRTSGHDIVRVSEVLPINATDEEIVERAIKEERVVLTQDLGFSAILALTGKTSPSLISLRLSSSRLEHVHTVLEKILPLIEPVVQEGAIITVEDQRLRYRRLPL